MCFGCLRICNVTAACRPVSRDLSYQSCICTHCAQCSCLSALLADVMHPTYLVLTHVHLVYLLCRPVPTRSVPNLALAQARLCPNALAAVACTHSHACPHWLCILHLFLHAYMHGMISPRATCPAKLALTLSPRISFLLARVQAGRAPGCASRTRRRPWKCTRSGSTARSLWTCTTKR